MNTISKTDKSIEDQLRHARQENQATLNVSQDKIYRVDKDGKILDGTQSATQISDLLPKNIAQDIINNFKQIDLWEDTPVRSWSFWHGEIRDRKFYEVRVSPINADEMLLLVKDATVEKQQSRSLQMASDAVEAKEKARSEFLSNMNFRTRTLVSGVRGALDLLAETPLDSAQREYVDLVETSSESFLEIVNDIIDLSRIEDGKLTLEKSEFDMRRVVDSVVDLLRFQTAGKDIRLDVEYDPDLPSRMIGDATRLRQVLFNLTENAIKHTEKGEIVIRFQKRFETEDRVQLNFTIKDSGSGISDQDKAEISKIFEYAKSSTIHKFGGTGLGLVIASKIIAVMKGRISLESEIGVGSTFNCVAEFGKPPEIAPLVQPKKETVAQESADLRVLIVEDNRFNRLILKKALEKQGGFQITESVDGKEGLDRFKNNDFDVIITDLHMPEMDGWEMSEAIRKIEKESNLTETPIIALTATVVEDARKRSLEIGINDFMPKPFTKLDLFETISRWTNLEK